MRPIISRKESLEILQKDLRRAELEKRAVDLSSATADKRAEILAQIDREVKQQLKRRAWRIEPDGLLH
jgi:hypothetical protein